MADENGLLSAWLLDGNGGGKRIAREDIDSPLPSNHSLWLHWDRKSGGTEQWLRACSGITPLICEALLAEETRPRSLIESGGMLAILRGVDANTGADPEDMIALRVWIESQRIVTMRWKKVAAIQDIADSLERGDGPKEPAGFVVALAWQLIERASPVLSGLDEELDGLEEKVLESQSRELRSQLGHLRRKAITLRRFLAPQRDALAKVSTERVPWLGDLERARLREAADRLTRYVEDLDALRERAAVTQEELAGRLSEQMNKTMYVLSLVAAVFLPLGLLTGLLGINVAGMPGTQNAWAFTIVCTILLALALACIWAFRRLNLF